ncbi:MAG: hypothetical protein IGS39_11120 [Calothrix sp. C42_A2020_038]|nr:hypothetical protein [Calothrix sp. C42_A2020_038]
MTSRSTEIQTLIADIDNLLVNNKGKRLARVLANQGQEPRQVLERVRNFLVELVENNSQPSQAALLSPLLARYISSDDSVNNQSQQAPNEIKHNDQNINPPQSQFNELRALIEPLQIELQTLLQERKNLVEEIRQLEQQRLHNYSLASQMANQEQMIAEFLQVLANRVSSFVPQLPEPIQPLSTPQQMYDKLATAPPLIKNHDSASTPTISETEQNKLIESISLSYGELDKKIAELDGNVNLSFEALQRNLNRHHESLCEALTRMQHEGVQGEQLLKHWIDNLMQQLQSVNILFSELNSKSQLAQTETQTKVSLPDLDPNLLGDTSSTPDLDALLLELNPGSNNSNLSTSKLSQQHTSAIDLQTAVSTDTPEPVSGDEVDLLYASLFGGDDMAVASQATSSVVRNPISVIQDLPTLETAPSNSSETEVCLDTIEIGIASNDSTDSIITFENENKNVFPDSIDSLDSSQFAATENLLDIPDDTEVSPEKELFSSEMAPQVPPETTPTENLQHIINITPSAPSLVAETTEAKLASIESEAQEIDDRLNTTNTVNTADTTFLPDPWLDNTDAGLLDLHDFQTQNSKTEVAQQVSNEWEAFIKVDTALSEFTEPTAVDTIALLTDLTFEDTPPLVSTNAIKENPQNQHNLTVSKEVLLSQAHSAVDAALPNILLDENQKQRLSEDLENFDSEQYLSSSKQPQSKQIAQTPTSEPLASGLTIAPEISEAEVKQHVSSVDNYQPIPTTVDLAWYLGIDLGTTGISAALLNRSTAEVYPLYWSCDDVSTGAKRSFRLPAEVYLPASAGVPIGSNSQDTTSNPTPTVQNLFSAELKPYLQIALPYKSEKQRTSATEEENKQESYKWEPVLQLNEVATVPLVWMVRSLSKLLLTLKSDRNSTTLGLTAAAMGINPESFRRIIDNISGVICSCPSNWSEQYRFNIREALLLSKLVSHPQQVFFVEEAIASLLSEIDGANGEEVKLNTRTGLRPAKSSDHSLQGNTLVMNIGASATEMGLVELPENLLELSHNDFMLHSFAYGGKGLEIDIVCQLLLSPKWRQSSSEKQSEEAITSTPWHWQPSIQGLEKTRLSSLKWEELTLPRAGEPDTVERIRLLQRLETSRLGQALLDAATAMKLVLQHQESFSFELGDQRWVLQRRDLESQIFVPFVRRLNRELNRLLVARGIPTEAINQAILTGGVATLGAVSRWLRQKLPNAKIIQDLYLGENGTPTCSRVAYGLSLLPLHPQVLEVSRQQYTDYFLFTELLHVLPEHTLSFGEVIGLFEERGINTRNCQQRLLAFLEGELPAGLAPSGTESIWLTQASSENSDYKALLSVPLFEKQGSLTYRPNTQQINYLRHFLEGVKASTQQSIEEPYTVNFAVGVPI